MTPGVSILLAEDDEADVELLKRAFKEVEFSRPVHFVRDGQEAVDFLDASRRRPGGMLPQLVILDLKMPRRDGLQVLRWMRAEPILRSIPVIIFSSSSNYAEIEVAYDLGANAFLTKPPSNAERREIARLIKDWLRFVQPPLASVEGIEAARAQRGQGVMS